MEYKFWMIFCPQGTPPTKPHDALKDAELEARRLAAENPGKDFIVLEALEKFTLGVAPVECEQLQHAPTGVTRG